MSAPTGIPSLGTTKFSFRLQEPELNGQQGWNLERHIMDSVDGVESVERKTPFGFEVIIADSALANIRDLQRTVVQVAYDFLVDLSTPTTR